MSSLPSAVVHHMINSMYMSLIRTFLQKETFLLLLLSDLLDERSRSVPVQIWFGSGSVSGSLPVQFRFASDLVRVQFKFSLA